jgi:hypothetical protein
VRGGWESALGRAAGVCALASGFANLGLLLDFGEASITAWNLLIIPTALYLGWAVASRRPMLAAVSGAAGVTASVLWAFSYRSPGLEPWWIGLAAAWWVGLGWLLVAQRRRFGWFTIILGIAAAVDFVVTLLNLPFPVYALGGFKIPLANVWAFWVGIELLRDPTLGMAADSDADAIDSTGVPRRWAGATALVGGALWEAFAVGWTLSHGSTQSPRGDTILNLGALEFTRLLAVPALLWAVSLVSMRGASWAGGSTPRRFGFALALLGALMVAAGAILQTSIVDPAVDFGHPAVQGGFLLSIAGLFPAVSVGLLLMGFASRREIGPVRGGLLVAGLLAPMPVFAFYLSGRSDGTPLWDAIIAVLHADPGLGWIILALALRAKPLVLAATGSPRERGR